MNWMSFYQKKTCKIVKANDALACAKVIQIYERMSLIWEIYKEYMSKNELKSLMCFSSTLMRENFNLKTKFDNAYFP